MLITAAGTSADRDRRKRKAGEPRRKQHFEQDRHHVVVRRHVEVGGIGHVAEQRDQAQRQRIDRQQDRVLADGVGGF
jgi:hypothetical protein